MNSVIADLNHKIVEECIDILTIASEGRLEPEDVIRYVADIVESTGGQLDACSCCGAMPITTNCNNAGCAS